MNIYAFMRIMPLANEARFHQRRQYQVYQLQQEFLMIQVNQVRYEDYVADLFTKLLPKCTFEKHVKSIGLLKLSDLP